MEEHEAHRRVVETGTQRHVTHRHHQDLERDEVAGDEHEEQDEIALEFVDRKRKAGEAGKRDRPNDGRDRHLERIQDVIADRRVVEDGRIVLETGKARGDAEIVPGGQVTRRAHRCDGNADQRQEPEEKCHRQQDLVGRLRKGRGLLDRSGEHQAFLSWASMRTMKSEMKTIMMRNRTTAIEAP